MKTLDLQEAAAFLHMHPEEVRTRAKRGLIPGAKTGRCWVFLDIDLAEFLRSLYPVRRQALRVTTISQEDVCHYANAGRSGGSTSLRPDGERVRRSAETGNKVQAQELHDKLKSEIWRLQRLGDRPRRIWQDAAVRWLHEQSHKATHEGDKTQLRWLDRYLAGRELESINRALIDTITEARRREGCANGTVNRTLSLLRAILRRCVREWEWMDRAPAIRLLKEPSRRIRFLTHPQAMVLLRELPAHLRAMAAFSLATGLRRANVTGLTWEQVDLARRLAWVHPDQAKGRKAIGVPLNDTALAILHAEVGKHPQRVFTYEGRPVFQVSSRAWYKALKRAGIEDFRWHDLRHTWASWHVQNGTPLFALQEMAGWETEKMVRRYAHLAVGHLAAYADALRIHGTILAQLPAPQKQLVS